MASLLQQGVCSVLNAPSQFHTHPEIRGPAMMISGEHWRLIQIAVICVKKQPLLSLKSAVNHVQGFLMHLVRPAKPSGCL